MYRQVQFIWTCWFVYKKRFFHDHGKNHLPQLNELLQSPEIIKSSKELCTLHFSRFFPELTLYFTKKNC